MKHLEGLLRLVIPLIAVAALLGCDARLPRPWEPTVPQKSFVGEWPNPAPTTASKPKLTNPIRP